MLIDNYLTCAQANRLAWVAMNERHEEENKNMATRHQVIEEKMREEKAFSEKRQQQEKADFAACVYLQSKDTKALEHELFSDHRDKYITLAHELKDLIEEAKEVARRNA